VAFLALADSLIICDDDTKNGHAASKQRQSGFALIVMSAAETDQRLVKSIESRRGKPHGRHSRRCVGEIVRDAHELRVTHLVRKAHELSNPQPCEEKFSPKAFQRQAFIVIMLG
jgi:hypothetical protein